MEVAVITCAQCLANAKVVSQEPSGMDLLQFIALCLELIGFGLAAVHVFRREWANRLGRWFISHIDRLDKDDTVLTVHRLLMNPWDESRWVKPRLGLRFYLLVAGLAISQALWVLTLYTGVELDDANGWKPWLTITFSTLLIFWLMFSFFPMIIYRMLKKASGIIGAGDYIAGFGIILAVLGILIEMFQVWDSPLWWGVIALAFIIIGSIYLFRKNVLPSLREDAEIVE